MQIFVLQELLHVCVCIIVNNEISSLLLYVLYAMDNMFTLYVYMYISYTIYK